MTTTPATPFDTHPALAAFRQHLRSHRLVACPEQRVAAEAILALMPHASYVFPAIVDLPRDQRAMVWAFDVQSRGREYMVGVDALAEHVYMVRGCGFTICPCGAYHQCEECPACLERLDELAAIDEHDNPLADWRPYDVE